MKILIDLQGAQTSGSRHRGIGRYSLSFTEGVLRNRGEHDVHILLNGAFKESLGEIHQRLGGFLPLENFHVFEPLSPVQHSSADNRDRRLASELMREGLIGHIGPDIVHVTSLFEGLGDEAVSSFGRLAQPVVNSVTLYDLIPHIHRGIYLENPTVRTWYDERLSQLRRADLLLSISASSGAEAVDYLGVSPQQVVNVSTAADPQFCKGTVSKKRRSELSAKYRIASRFVMYTGGIDYRKNIERLITAFASLPKKVRASTTLAIVCSCSAAAREDLTTLAHTVGLSDESFVMTGFVPDEDLIDLYRLAHLFVFPSWHEGFGLPLLEAMRCATAVIAGNRSSLPEVVGREDAMFDPLDEAAIRDKMERVLTDEKFRMELAGFAPKQATKFSWDLTTKKALAAFEESIRAQSVPPEVRGQVLSAGRPRLAYVSPLPPAKSGIADYSAEVLTELTRHYEVDAVIPQGPEFQSEMDPALLENIRIISPADLLANAGDYQRVMYHFGNSDHHGHMAELIRSVPGVVVLHDFYLSGLFAVMQHVHGVPHTLDEAIYASHGYQALADANGRKSLQDAMWMYPCNRTVLERALGVIVHSTHAVDLARKWYGSDYAADWKVVPLMRAPVSNADRSRARATLGLDDRDFVICSFGGIGETKLTDLLVDAFAKAKLGSNGKVRLVLVGAYPQTEFGAKLRKTIEAHPYRDRIEVIGWVERDTYRTHLAAADMAVQLRTLSRGETSAAVLDCLNWELPTIVNSNGSMVDIPDECALKLPDQVKAKELAAALDRLYSDDALRTKIAGNGARLVRTEYSPRKCAEAYRDSIEDYYRQEQVHPLKVADRIGRACPALSEHELASLAVEIEAFPARHMLRPVLIDVERVVGGSVSADDAQSMRRIRKEIERAESSGRPSMLVSRKNDLWETRHDLALKSLGLPDGLLPDHLVSSFPERRIADWLADNATHDAAEAA
jgi:glycosyltransferase involved in cell wall biosynthesis